ncbi:MAG: hypothetical protein JNJ57_17735 [Saprospiraceae bacterium]|nr:hypothetical protein [Saprospiraceae bacterium]
MPIQSSDIFNLNQKVTRYKDVLANTLRYRTLWQESLRGQLVEHLSALVQACGLSAQIEERKEIENLEAVVVNLGTTTSGLKEPIGGGLQRDLIKQNGSLVYQQLFNGKILVLINLPFIEKYGQPQPPKTIAVYRPEELKEPYLIRHMETLVGELTLWEDYDDDAPEPNQRIGFKVNFEDGKGVAAG